MRSSYHHPGGSRLCRDERGQGLIEYALIIVLASIVVVGALSLLGADVEDFFGSVFDVLD